MQFTNMAFWLKYIKIQWKANEGGGEYETNSLTTGFGLKNYSLLIS